MIPKALKIVVFALQQLEVFMFVRDAYFSEIVVLRKREHHF